MDVELRIQNDDDLPLPLPVRAPVGRLELQADGGDGVVQDDSRKGEEMNGCAVCRTPSDALSGGLCERCHGEVDRWQHAISESLSRMEARRNGVSGMRNDHSA